MPRGHDSRITLRARAKINLCLEILGKRPDGYHDIRSVVLPVSLGDTVTVQKARTGIQTEVSLRGVPGDGLVRDLASRDNLATRAATALKRATGRRAGARIRIEKRIPVGGGLGGGSADAAAVLLGLNAAWGLDLPVPALMEIGAGIGCDVPALVRGGAVVVEGIGEQVTAVPSAAGASRREPWWVVIVNPGFSVSTGDMYARHRSTLTSRRSAFNNIRLAVAKWDLGLVARNLFNDLQAAVFGKYPLIGMVAEGLKKSGAIGVLVSGSGSSVFGLARNRREALGIRRRVRARLGCPVWTRVVRALPDGVTVAHGPLEARV